MGLNLRLALALVAALFALAACVTDLNPEGGWSGPVEDGEFLYIGSKDGRMVRVARSTGALDQTWTYPAEEDDDLGEIYGTPAISNGVIYGSAFRCNGNDCEGEVFAAHIETGRSAWAAGPVAVKSRLVGAVGVGASTLAVGTSAIDGKDTPGGYLLGLDPTADAGRDLSAQVSRREKWRIPLDGAVWGGVAVADDVAYFGTLGGTLYAVDLADSDSYTGSPAGRVLWTYDVGGAISGTPHVTDTNVYVGSFSNELLKLNLAYRQQNPTRKTLDPSLEWSFDTGEWIWAEPLLVDGVVYVANLPGQVYALSAVTGQPQWQTPAEVGKEIVGQPAIFESNRGPALAVASGEKDVAVVVLSSGQVSGELNTRDLGIKSAPLVIGDVIFVHTDSGQFRQYQAGTLSLLKCIEAKGSGKSCD